MYKKIKKITPFRYSLITLVSTFLLFTTDWIYQYCGDIYSDSITISLKNKITITSFFNNVILPTIISFIIIYLFLKIVNILYKKNTSEQKCQKIIVLNLINSFVELFCMFYALITAYVYICSINALQIINVSNYIMTLNIIENIYIPTFNLYMIFVYSIIAALLFCGIKFLFNLIIIKTENTKKIVHFILSIIKTLLYFFSIVAFFSVEWILKTFGEISADSFIFHLNVPLKGINITFYISYMFAVLIPAIFIVFILFALITINENYNLFIVTKKKIKVSRLLLNILICAIPVIIIILSFNKLSRTIGLSQYIKDILNDSSFIDNNYVEPRETDIIFPDKKRNLIYIFMESMENTYMSEQEGGIMKENLIPELTEIANKNIYFSNTDGYGGAIPIKGTTWTIAAMVSQHMGIPLLLPIDNNDYGKYKTFLPGGYSLGDILQKEGYNQTLIVGSDSEFGGRKSYFQQHGNYKILDLFTSWEDGIVPDNRTVFWGFEDLYLYEYAKKELQYLSSQDKPFNLTMLTVDTHHVEGYLCKLCQKEHNQQYWNAISCASRQLSNFLSWLQQQDFYKNTTIVISGDHISMSPIIKTQMDSNYIRTTYNVFINSMNTSNNTKNRVFSTMDMFPTTLASLGVEIKGDRLGLGTNLFSNTPTLLEKYSIKDVKKGLSARSNQYSSILMGQ